jgi:tetratricopeptide (TPR) repeat protein
MAACVALVCGVLGAWGYSHFFGPGKSGEQKSASKNPNSALGSTSPTGSSSVEGSSSGRAAGSTQVSKSSPTNSNSGDYQTAQTAWLTAVKELRQVREDAKAAQRSAEETKAILDFLKRTLLSAGRTGEVSIAQAFWAGGQNKDVTLRKAVDVADSQVSESFADRPLAEASVREMLGLAYLNLGDAARAVPEYERALALREAFQGTNAPETAECRNQLAIAYRLAGRADEGSRLYQQNPNSPSHAAELAVRGSTLLLQNKPAEAELVFRASLAIRQKAQPDDWTTFDTMSLLGEALLAQKKFAEAEPQLVSGYEGLKRHQESIPAQEKSHLTQALERLVRLYEAWGKPDEAAKWRKEQSTASAAPSPAS